MNKAAAYKNKITLYRQNLEDIYKRLI